MTDGVVIDLGTSMIFPRPLFKKEGVFYCPNEHDHYQPIHIVMNLQEFEQEFMEGVNFSMEMEGIDLESALTENIMEYLQDTGEVGAPIVAPFKKTKAAISAYDYNEEANSLDMFITIQPDTPLGKVNNGKIDDAFNRLMRFYNEALDGTVEKTVEDKASAVMEAVDLIKDTKGKVDALRMFVLTNGLNNEYEPTFAELDDHMTLSQTVWDMQRVFQQYKIRAGKEKIEVDFSASYGTELQCIKMAKSDPEVDGYLAIIPGITLAQVYNNYQQTLLEKNVRTFLQFKAKVNRGIRNTLVEKPSMFFSYNNGISTTASRVDTHEVDGVTYITRMEDWQIVNGGQTTASIAATYAEKKYDLSKVFVAMKVSVIPNEEKGREEVPMISKYANSQTAVKDSDQTANEPYLVQLENFSRSVWVPNGNAKSVTKWYFERTRGQYLDDKAHQIGLKEKEFITNYPKQNKLTKTDIAKFDVCWEQHPDIVCRGGEKCYDTFIKDIKDRKPTATENIYKRLIAKGVLYKIIDKYVNSLKLGGYKSNMDNYLLASLSFISGKMLDLDYIWEHQNVQPELMQRIEQLVPIVWKHITEPTQSSNAQSVNVNEWTKRSECWNSLKVLLQGEEPLASHLKLDPLATIDDSLNPAQQEAIDQAWAIDAEVWKGIAKWAKENNQLTPLDRKMAFSFGQYKASGRMFSFKQANAGLKIIKKCKELGYEGE